jgi:hypothetical protein
MTLQLYDKEYKDELMKLIFCNTTSIKTKKTIQILNLAKDLRMPLPIYNTYFTTTTITKKRKENYALPA